MQNYLAFRWFSGNYQKIEESRGISSLGPNRMCLIRWKAGKTE